MVPGAVRALAARNLELPRDLSLVGCDDIILAELYRPPIAVVKCDNYEVGRLTAELLIQGMQSEEPPRDVFVATEFLPRGSCGPPSALAVTLIFIPDTEAAERMDMAAG